MCEGGRTFQYPVTITIALLFCDQTQAAHIHVNYSLEFYGHDISSRDCGSYKIISTSVGRYCNRQSWTCSIFMLTLSAIITHVVASR
jgi:hypothetical protein